jgi:phenylpropionate dioxygenase-like ring-hydroxylating dioxygenase large terminal subunit
MFVVNAWYVAASCAEVVHEILPRRLLGQPLILWRTERGDVVAMQDSCPHRRVPLSIASLVGDEVRCGYHGMQFDRSGKCTHVPGQEKAHPNARVGTFPVVEKHNLVWIWLGDAQQANLNLVPDVHWLDDPNWVAVVGYLHVKADYRLATDNLLDLSHETYVHSHTIGNEAVAENPVRVELVRDRLVQAHREIPDQEPPPFIAQTVGTAERINRWQTAIYLPPGVHMTEAGVYPVSVSREDAYVTRVLHLLTPETEHSTHYFWAMCRNYRRNDPGLGEIIKQGLTKTFDEDRAVLELQSARLREEGNPSIPVAAIRVDEAPIRARRLLAAILDKEQSDSTYVALPIDLTSGIATAVP